MSEPHQYLAGGIVYKRANPADDTSLQALLRDNAMDGWVQLSLERAPSYFAGEGLMGEGESIIAYTDNDTPTPVGMYHCDFMFRYINGEAKKCGYLGGLRVSKEFRNRVRILRHGYESIPALMRHHQPTVWMTSLAEENQKARRLLEAGLKGLPRYRNVDKLETLALSTRYAKDGNLLRSATAEDIDALVSFYNDNARSYQFAPQLGHSWLAGLDGRHGLCLSDFCLLEKNKEIKGCLALWDQRSFKQTVARGYRFPLNLLRPAYNAWALIAGRTPLPAIGAPLQSIYFAFAIFPTTPDLACQMVREALFRARERGAQIAVFGLSPRNPIHRTLLLRFHPATYRTCIETVTWPPHAPPDLDGRPVQPEVALL